MEGAKRHLAMGALGAISAVYSLAAVADSGWVSGGGRVGNKSGEIKFAFKLHCDADEEPNRLEIRLGHDWDFRLLEVQSAYCSVGQVGAPSTDHFDTVHGVGIGSINGDPGFFINYIFVDNGEPGVGQDEVVMTIYQVNPDGSLTEFLDPARYELAGGNIQAHSGKNRRETAIQPGHPH